MKATINGVVIEGTPQELQEYQQLMAPGPIVPAAPSTPAPPSPVPPQKIALNSRGVVSVSPMQHAVLEYLRAQVVPPLTTDIVKALKTPVGRDAMANRLLALQEKGLVEHPSKPLRKGEPARWRWQLTLLAQSLRFEPTYLVRGAAATKMANGQVATATTATTTPRVLPIVLPVIHYDVVQTMREYGEPMTAPAIATLMGITTSCASGRLQALKATNLVEQVNYKTWRLTDKATSLTIIPEGFAG